ncbi:ASB_collapsed_G0009870.mRNA.1.CDS.1 [Saccharomyces cerevisiae]|nr:ASB_collapsed_G0009870.mRNA.1.CDS.1 [Saccharomyces cerevisiae]
MTTTAQDNSPKKRQRIINCVTQLPYKIQLGESNDDWKISATTGNSALYSSLEYLQFDSTEYEQHVVGWTGEITRTERNLFTREAKEKPQDLDDDPLYLTKEQINGLTTTLQDHMKSDKEAKTDTTQTAPVTNNEG